MARMNQRLGILKRVVDALDDEALTQEYLVPQRHEPVLHVGPDARNEVKAVVEEFVEKPLRDVAAVREEPAVKLLRQHLPHPRVAVVGIGGREDEGDNLRPVVAHEVNLKAVAPTHRPLPVGSQAGEHFVGIAPHVVAHGYHGRIHIAHAVAAPEGDHLQEEHHNEEHPSLKLHEPDIGHRCREEVLPA